MNIKTKNSGIYKITCLANHKIYIGSAINLRYRINRHLNDLKREKHSSSHLQNAFKKYGEENFIVEIIEEFETGTISNKDLLMVEQKYLDLFKPYNNDIGFNSCQIAGSPEQKKLSNETKRKISESSKGHSVSEETKKKIGDAHRGKKMSKEAIELNKKWHTGIKQSEDSILKRAKQYSFIDSEGNIYIGNNLKRFCDEHKLHRPNMNLVLKGIRNSHHGFKKY